MAREAEVHEVQPGDGVLGAQPGVVALELQPGSVALPAPIGVATVVRRAGPRLARDGFGPLAIFFTGWKLIGLTAGILMAVAFGLTIFVHERRAGRPATVVRLALLLVAIRALVGFTSGSARVYLAQEIAIDVLLGSAVLASLRTRRPFASWFAEDVYPFPEEMRESQTFMQAMRTVTLVWGAYFFARGLVRVASLLTLSTDRYALVIALTDAPFLIALLAWSVYHTSTVFRASDEWGAMMAAAEQPAGPPTAGG
jgi:hypothetical protein